MLQILHARPKATTPITPPPPPPDPGLSELELFAWEDFNAIDISFQANVTFSDGSAIKRVVVNFIDRHTVPSPLGVVHTETIDGLSNGVNNISFQLPTTSPRIYYDKIEAYAQDDTGISDIVEFETGSFKMDFSGSDGWNFPSPTKTNEGGSFNSSAVNCDFFRGGIGQQGLNHVGGGFSVESTGGPDNGPMIQMILDKDATVGRQRSEFELEGRWNPYYKDLDNIQMYVPHNRDRVNTSSKANNFRNYVIGNNGLWKDARNAAIGGQAIWQMYFYKRPTRIPSTSNTIVGQAGKRFDGPGSPPHQHTEGSRIGNSLMCNWVQIGSSIDITPYDPLGDGGQGNPKVYRGRWDNWHDLGPNAEFDPEWKCFVSYRWLRSDDQGITKIWIYYRDAQGVIQRENVLDWTGANLYSTGNDGQPWIHESVGDKLSYYDSCWNCWEGEPDKIMYYADWRMYYDKGPNPYMYDIEFFDGIIIPKMLFD